MAFMEHNREINGAAEPAATAREEAAEQREQERLQTNPTNLGQPQKRTFEPDLMTPEAISRRHKMGGLDEAEWKGYEDMIPCGPEMA